MVFSYSFGITHSNPHSVFPDSSFEDLGSLTQIQLSLAEVALNGSGNTNYTFNNTSSATGNSILKYRNKTLMRFDFEAIYKKQVDFRFFLSI